MKQRMKLWMMAAILIISGTTVLTSCSKDDDNKAVVQPVKEYFTLWNQCEALTALQNYVKDVTNPNSPNFIKEEDRIATFDMDGTFVGELYPTYFEYNLLEYRALDDPAYKNIAPEDVKETAQNIRDFVRNGTKLPSNFDMKHAYAAAKAYSGMTLKEFDDYVKAYAKQPANGFSGMTYGQSHYKPMLQVFDYLKDNGFTYYVVSGSDRFICRALVENIGIPMNRVIGMDMKLRSSKQNTDDGVSYTMGRRKSARCPCCRSATAAATVRCTTMRWAIRSTSRQPLCSWPTMMSAIMPTSMRLPSVRPSGVRLATTSSR